MLGTYFFHKSIAGKFLPLKAIMEYSAESQPGCQLGKALTDLSTWLFIYDQLYYYNMNDNLWNCWFLLYLQW